MKSLELKIPPPLVALLMAAAMWWVQRYTPPLAVPEVVRIWGAITLVLAGGAMDVAAVTTFRRRKTTINPLRPQRTTAFVSTGVYRATRNPMYLGMLLVLSGWSVFLASAWAVGGLPAFVLYIGRFQIAPEERMLANLFGDDYANYQRRVRRWL